MSEEKSELEAESYQNPPDLENQFLHRWNLYSTDGSFETGHFLMKKKGVATINLGKKPNHYLVTLSL
jgi:hypothetical protein